MGTTEPSQNTNPSMAPADRPVIPDCVNEENFVDTLEESVNGFKRILKIDAEQAVAAGENYASSIWRVKIKVKLKDESTKDVSFILKTVPQSELSSMVTKQTGKFPKEQLLYDTYIPKYEQMYRDAGKDLRFGPKFFKLKKNPRTDFILMEDLSMKCFKNLNRLEGLDKVHTESVLKLIAEFHAVSAVRYETKGEYNKSLKEGFHTEANRDLITTMRQSAQVFLKNSLLSSQATSKYIEKLEKLESQMTDLKIKLAPPDPTEFNVLVHGDFWCNNIMFRHDDEGNLDATCFVDFQNSRYSSPVIDLYYLLMTSVKFELKISHIDEFVKYYYDHLVENLKLLRYPKEVPTMKDLRMQLLKRSFWGVNVVTGIMAPLLLDPSGMASFENYLEGGEKGKQFKMQLYNNPRFLKHIAAILPWMDTMGFLD